MTTKHAVCKLYTNKKPMGFDAPLNKMSDNDWRFRDTAGIVKQRYKKQ